MVNAYRLGEFADVAAKAAGDVMARQHFLEDALAGTAVQVLPKLARPMRDPEVARYIRSELEMWSDKADEPTFEITKFWTKTQLERDSNFEHAI